VISEPRREPVARTGRWRSPSGDPAQAADEAFVGPAYRPVRVGLIEDHHLVREGLRLVLTANGFEVVGECPSVEGAFELVDRHRPDVILLDLSLVDGDGVPLLRELHVRSPETRVIVVTMYRDPETVRQALLAGADGYVVKGAHSVDLVEAINAVMRGERYLHSSITSVVVDDSIRWLQSGGVLTAREREILGLLASKLGPIEIGGSLGISPHTVRRHLANLSEKLGTRGTAALVEYAIREGLVRKLER
jgi:two-component system, NarL family, response regulator NreC